MEHNHYAQGFRADIAGLRALAVLPILLFHAGLSGLGGGFVGVDVFFVISGFLITGIIVRDLDADRFSMMEFYRRRVARIAPALILVLVITLAAGVLLMLPSELRELGVSTAAAASFISNFHFLATTDYFGGAAESKPLLHTWSLAVEEQFYIFFPILMVFVSRWRRKWLLPVVVVITIGSFILALVVARFRPEIAFYMLPTRAWELGIGVMIALGAAPQSLAPRTKQALALTGLGLILASIVLVRPNDLFPAPLALGPTVGAGLLIAYGREGLTAKLLSTRPLVWIGDISYSLYLWHWPIITLYRLYTGVSLDLLETAGLVLASIVAAALTRPLLEEPARKWLTRLPRRPVVTGGIVALLVTVGLALASPRIPDDLRPLPDRALQLASLADYRDTEDYKVQFRKGICFWGESDAQPFDRGCLAIQPGRPNWVVFGDSHAAQYWRALTELWPNRYVIQATASGCRPVIGTDGDKRCTELVDYVFSDLLFPDRVEGVVFAGRWTHAEVPKLARTVAEIRRRGLQVIVIGPGVEYDGDMPLLMARAVIANDLSGMEDRRLPERRYLDVVMADPIRRAGAVYASEYETECPKGECMLLDDRGDPLHFDYGHLTLNASRIIVGRLGLALERGQPIQPVQQLGDSAATARQ